MIETQARKLAMEREQCSDSQCDWRIHILLNHPAKQGNRGMICLTREPRRQVSLKRDELS